MTDIEMSSRLEMRWIEVSDGNGRTHLESRWLEVPGPATHFAHAA